MLKTPVLFIISLIFLNPNLSSAQEVMEKEKSTYFTLQGGLFVDVESDFIEGQKYNLNHVDVKKLSVGSLRFKDNKASQILLEGSYYETNFGVDVTQNSSGGEIFRSGISLSKLVLEAEYFRSLYEREAFANNLHLGYFAALNYTKTDIRPLVLKQIPIDKNSYVLNVGLKAIYIYSLTEKLNLTIGADVVLINTSVNYTYRPDPSIPERLHTTITILDLDFIGTRFGLDIGIVF